MGIAQAREAFVARCRDLRAAGLAAVAQERLYRRRMACLDFDPDGARSEDRAAAEMARLLGALRAAQAAAAAALDRLTALWDVVLPPDPWRRARELRALARLYRHALRPAGELMAT